MRGGRPTRLMVVTPEFHGYWRSIERAFQHLGYEVTSYCYDAAPRGEKLFNKVRYELPAQLRGQQRHLSEDTVTTRACEALAGVRPDLLLVVRGDSLTRRFWEQAAEQHVGTAVWLYDELRRMRLDISAVTATGAGLATYSAADARSLTENGLPTLHVPLAFDPDAPVTERDPSGEFSFIGARFPKREASVKAILANGLPVRAYGRGWSDHPIDRARTWRVSSSGVPSGRDLPLDETYGVMRASAGTLNIHGDQDGFTMRTFEACGVGGVQLIDRADVCDFYEPGSEVLVFEDDAELVDQCRRILADPGRMAGLRQRARRRTLAEHTFVHRARRLQTIWDR